MDLKNCINIVSVSNGGMFAYIASIHLAEAAEHMKSYLLKDMWENN